MGNQSNHSSFLNMVKLEFKHFRDSIDSINQKLLVTILVFILKKGEKVNKKIIVLLLTIFASGPLYAMQRPPAPLTPEEVQSLKDQFYQALNATQWDTAKNIIEQFRQAGRDSLVNELTQNLAKARSSWIAMEGPDILARGPQEPRRRYERERAAARTEEEQAARKKRIEEERRAVETEARRREAQRKEETQKRAAEQQRLKAEIEKGMAENRDITQALQKRIEEQDAQLSRLQSERDRAATALENQQISSLEQLSKLEAQLRKLQGEREAADILNRQLASESRDLAVRMRALEERAKDAGAGAKECRDLRARLTETEKTTAELLRQLEQARKQAEEARGGGQQQIDALRQQLDQAREQKQRAENEIKQYEKALERANQEKEKIKKEAIPVVSPKALKDCQDKLAQAEQKEQALRKQIEELNKNLGAVSKQILTPEELAEAKKKLLSQEQQKPLRKVEERYVKEKEKAEHLENENKALKKEINVMHKAQEEVKRLEDLYTLENKELKSKNEQLNKDLQTATAQLTASKEVNIDAEERLEKLQTELEERKRAQERITQERQAVNEQIKNEVQDLRQKLTLAEEVERKLRAQQVQLEEENNKLKQEAKIADQMISRGQTRKEELTKCKDELDLLKEELNKSKEQIRKCKETIQELLKKNAESKRSLDRAGQEIDAILADIDNLAKPDRKDNLVKQLNAILKNIRETQLSYGKMVGIPAPQP